MGTTSEHHFLRSVLLLLPICLSMFFGSIYFLDNYSPADPLLTPASLPEMMFRTAVSFDFYLARLRNLVLPANIRVMELTTGFMTTKALYTACKYKIADALHAYPLSTEELARVTHTNPQKLNRVMQHLHVRGVFKLIHSKWTNTHLSSAIRTSNPNNVISEVTSLVHSFYDTFSDLAQAVAEPPSRDPMLAAAMDGVNTTRVFGRGLDEPAVLPPPPPLQFPLVTREEGLVPYLLKPWNPLQDYRLEKFKNKRVCDVRVGTSDFLPALLKKVPSVRGVIFNAPALLATTRAQFEESYPELIPHVQFVEAAFPHELPFADVYLFRNIFNRLDDESVIKMLQVAHKVIQAHGKGKERIVWTDYELDLPYPHIHPLISSIDLAYMVHSNGSVRTVEERERLLRSAGFAPILTRRVNSMYAVTEARLSDVQHSAHEI